MKWLNASNYNMFLTPIKLPSGQVVLSFMGDVKKNSAQLEKLKFKPFKVDDVTQFYICLSLTGSNGKLKPFNPQHFINELPKLFVDDMEKEDVFDPAVKFFKNYHSTPSEEASTESEGEDVDAEKAEAKKKAQENKEFESSLKKSLKRASVQMAQSRELGLNLQGEMVYEDMTTRYIKTVAGDILRSSDGYTEEPRFLKAGNLSMLSPLSIAESVKGFVMGMVKGEELTYPQLEKITSIIFSDYEDVIKKNPTEQFRLNIIIQRAIEINLLDPIKSEVLASDKDEKLITKISDLFLRRPIVPASEYPKQFVYDRGIPPVVSVLAGEYLSEVKGQIIIPNAVNGLITSALPENCDVVANVEKGTLHMGVMRNSHLNDHVTQLNEINLSEQSYLANSADGMVVAMRSGDLSVPIVIDDISIIKRDQYETMRSLHALTENGKAIVVVGGDGNKSLGNVSAESEDFHQWLYTYYKVRSVIDMDSALYGKSGDGESSRVYAIEGKRLIPSKEVAPKDIKVAISPLQMWSWKEELVDKIEAESKEVKSLSAGTILNTEEIVINDFQVKYIAMVPIGLAGAMVPKNLSNPLRIGFSKFLKDHDDPLEFLKSRLSMDTDELSSVFNSEQLDALCLSIWNHERGQGFINGDMGGKGKGRFLAGMIRYGIIHNKPTVFMTNKKDLFHDIYRDMKDINSEHLMKPFVVNGSSAPIIDGVAIKHRTSTKQVTEHIDKQTFPDANVYFCTYSQISRVPASKTIIADDGTEVIKNTNKAHWLGEAVKGGLLLADESHEMSGASNTNVNFTHLSGKVDGVSFASATWSRSPENISAYTSLFPAHITSEDIKSAIKKGKEPVQEIISATLAADGKFVCREHDMSLIKADVEINEADRERNIDYSNDLAQFLQAWAVLTNEIADFIGSSNNALIQKMKAAGTFSKSRHKNIGLNNVGFGSRITHIVEQFMLAINIDEVIKKAEKSLKSDNEKPLIALEHTGGALLKSVFDQKKADLVELGSDDKAINKAGITLDEMPTFGDLLRHAVKNSLVVSKKTTASQKRIDIRSTIKSAKIQGKVDASLGELDKIIEKFDTLPFSPLDEIINGLKEKGIEVGEVSGRQHRVEKVDDRYILKRSKGEPVKKVIDGFNGGDVDCLLFTRSGSNGHSMHSSIKFADQRQRRMIILENPASAITALQVRWRINREGQVHLPKYTVLVPDLPLVRRKYSLANRGVRQVSSNTNSNRRNTNEMTEVFDIIGPIGDMAFQRYLSARPDLLRKLNMTVADIGKDDSSLERNSIESLSLKATGRLVMLTYDEQLRVYDEVTAQAKAISASLDSQGINIVNPRNLDLKAREISRTVYMGKEKTYYDSEFDRPVEVVELEHEYTPKVINAKDLLALVNRGKDDLIQDSRMDDYGDDLSPMAEMLEKEKTRILSEWIPPGSGLSLKALMDDDARGYLVNRENAKLKFMIQILEEIGPGSILHDRYYQKDWVVSHVELPFKGSENNPGLYSLTMHSSKGFNRRQELTLDEMFLINDGQFELMPEKFTGNHTLAVDFDSQSTDPEIVRRLSLEGNLFEAVILAGNERLGMPTVYTDHKGASKRGILIAENLSKHDLMQRPVPFRHAKEAADYLRAHPRAILGSSQEIKSSTDVYLRVSLDKTHFKLYVPNNINKGAKFWSHGTVTSALHNREFTEQRGSRTVDVYDDELEAALEKLMGLGCKFLCEPGKLQWIQDHNKGMVVDIPSYDKHNGESSNNASTPKPF
jgi:hypothetical protein